MLRILASSFLMILALLTFQIDVSAKENENKPLTGIESQYPNKGEGNIETQISIQSNLYLIDGQSFINSSGNTVTVSGNTKASTTVDTIVVNLYLQRWDASQVKWIDVVHIDEFRNYYNSSIYGGKDVIVVPGYYYRTRSHHWLIESGLIENAFSYSPYIYID